MSDELKKELEDWKEAWETATQDGPTPTAVEVFVDQIAYLYCVNTDLAVEHFKENIKNFIGK